MNKQDRRSKGSKQSYFSKLIDKLGNKIYLAFIKGNIGKTLVSQDELYKKSLTAKVFERSRDRAGKAGLEAVFEQSRVLRAISSFNGFLASISFNVYGIFMIVYGIVSIMMYYVSIALNGRYSNGDYAFILPLIMIICGIPMLASSASTAQTISKSRIMRKLSLSFLGIPEEKLKTKTVFGGTEITFFSSIFAVLFGIFTYFLHPAYFPALFGVIVLLCLIGSSPETGVIITVTAVPFLQYTRYSNEILVALILITLLSYLTKIIKRRRIVRFGSKTVMILLFCGFVLVGSLFSAGGITAVKDALLGIVIIIGGFFLTHNLIQTEKRFDTCLKALVVSFVTICVLGMWGMLYNGFYEGVFYSIRETIAPIFEKGLVYVADSASVFSVFAVAVFPLFLSYMTRQKSIKGKALLAVSIIFVAIASFVYGTYEAIIAMAIEAVIFIVLYSRRSFIGFIVFCVSTGIVICVYPYLAKVIGWPTIDTVLSHILPLNDSDSSTRISVGRAVVDMLTDGNVMGIGVGKEAFIESFNAYSDVVTEGATSPGTLFLQILCWSGVGGMISFTILMITVIKDTLGYVIFSRKSKYKSNVLALLSSLTVMLIFGMVNCIWNDGRTLYLFWMYIGLVAGYVRRCSDIEYGRRSEFSCESDSTEIELKFYKNSVGR